jgi:hypothetical protein
LTRVLILPVKSSDLLVRKTTTWGDGDERTIEGDTLGRQRGLVLESSTKYVNFGGLQDQAVSPSEEKGRVAPGINMGIKLLLINAVAVLVDRDVKVGTLLHIECVKSKRDLRGSDIDQGKPMTLES